MQEDTTASRSYGGTGLGTTISKKLTTLLKGKISFKSVLNKGTTFWVEIPFQLTDQKVNVTMENQIAEDFKKITKKYNILLVEDYIPNQKIAEEHLKNMGCSVDIASNGMEAVQKFNAKSYDLVLMDVQMPKMNGFEATEIIQLTNKNKSVPIVGLTANAFADDRKKCIQSGMKDVITKPFRKSTFARKVSYWLTNKEATQNNNDQIIEKDNKYEGKAFDFEALLEEVDNNNELMKELVEEFFLAIDDQTPKIEKASEENDFETIRSHTHSIKGGALNLFFTNIGNTAARIEKYSKHKIDTYLIPVLIHDLIKNINEVKSAWKTHKEKEKVK